MTRVGESDDRAAAQSATVARKASDATSGGSPTRDSGRKRLGVPGRVGAAISGPIRLVLYCGGLLLTVAAVALTIAAFIGTWLAVGPRRSDVRRRGMAARPLILASALTALGALIGVILVNPSPEDPALRFATADADSQLDPVAQVLALAEWEAATQSPVPLSVARTFMVRSGDNLASLLRKAGVDRVQAYAAVRSLRGIYDPRRDFRVGDALKISMGTVNGPGPNGSNLAELLLPVAYNRDVVVRRTAGGEFVAEEVVKVLERELVQVNGTINASLFQDGRAAGIPIPVIAELIRIYSFSVDFQRELQKGDRFELVFERFLGRDGEAVHDGKVQFAQLTLRGAEQPVYLYETSEGDRDYFTGDGSSIRRALMRTPIDGARLSSGFGRRRHPILGYTRVHSGIDFAASRGTPIFAAGDGRITQAGRNGAYGNYIRIRHNSAYETAYAHLNGYAKGMKVGTRIRQGQVIGYVGSTGRATGSHLHYEIIQDGRQINPMKLRLPSGEKLKAAELERFLAYRDRVDALYSGAVVADNNGSATCTGDGAETTTTC